MAGPKKFYSVMEKMPYAVVMASQKPPLFHNSQITVPTSLPLCDMFENDESTGRIRKWAVEIAPFTLAFVASKTIKS